MRRLLIIFMVTVCTIFSAYATTPMEAAEDIEISLAALEHRPPDLAGRASPKKTEIMR